LACVSWFVRDSDDPEKEDRIKAGKDGRPVCGHKFAEQRMNILTLMGFAFVSRRRL
jgi:hypothetical protein